MAHSKNHYENCLKWRRKNKEKVRQYNLAYRLKFRERELKRSLDRLKTKESAKYFKQWRLKNNAKVKAHYLANRAVKTGKILKKQNCEFCGKTGKIHMHHEDYSKPFDVIFLCISCHRLVHRGNLAIQ